MINLKKKNNFGFEYHITSYEKSRTNMMSTLNIKFCIYVSYKTYMADIKILECSNILAGQENKRAGTVCVRVNVYFHVER